MWRGFAPHKECVKTDKHNSRCDVTNTRHKGVDPSLCTPPVPYAKIKLPPSPPSWPCCLVLPSLGGSAGSTMRGTWSCLRGCCPRPWRTFVQGGYRSSGPHCFMGYPFTPWDTVWMAVLREGWGYDINLHQEAEIPGMKWHHTMWCRQCSVAKPVLSCRRWQRGRSGQRSEELRRKTETCVFLLPPLPSISPAVFRRHSGMLSSPQQAPRPVWSDPRPYVFLRSAARPTTTDPSQLRMAVCLKT